MIKADVKGQARTLSYTNPRANKLSHLAQSYVPTPYRYSATSDVVNPSPAMKRHPTVSAISVQIYLG